MASESERLDQQQHYDNNENTNLYDGNDEVPDDEKGPWDQRTSRKMSGGDASSASTSRGRAFLDDGGDEETQSDHGAHSRGVYKTLENFERQQQQQQQQQQLPEQHEEDEEEPNEDKPHLSTMQKYLQRHQQANYQSDKDGEDSEGEEDEGDLPSLGGSSGPLPRRNTNVTTPRLDDDDGDSVEGPMPVTTYNTPSKINDHHNNNNSGNEPEDEEVRMMTMMASQAIHAHNQPATVTPSDDERAGKFWNQLELDDDDDEDVGENPSPVHTPDVNQGEPPRSIGTAEDEEEDDDDELDDEDEDSSYGPRRLPPKQRPQRRYSKTSQHRNMDEDDYDEEYTIASDVDTWEDGSVAPMDEAANGAILDANTFCGQTLTTLTDICGFGADTTIPTHSTTPRRSRSSRTGREEKEAIIQAAKRRKAKAEAMRASNHDEDSRSSFGSEGYHRRRHQSPLSQRTQEDENTAIEVEFVEQPTKEAQAAAAKRKNAVLAAMARKARADFEEQGPPRIDRRLEEEKEEDDKAATPQDLYATFTPTEKRKFLRMINEDALQPARAAQSILDEREKNNEANATQRQDDNTTNTRTSKRGGIQTTETLPGPEQRTTPGHQQKSAGRFAFWKKKKAQGQESSSDDNYESSNKISKEPQQRKRGERGSKALAGAVSGASAGATAAAALLTNDASNHEPLSESGIAYYDGKRRDDEAANETERMALDAEDRGADGKRASSAQRRHDTMSKTRFLSLSQVKKRSKSAPHGLQSDDDVNEDASSPRQETRSVSAMRNGGREAELSFQMSPQDNDSAVKKERGLDTSRLTTSTAPLSPKSLVSAFSEDEDDVEYPLPRDQTHDRFVATETLSPEGEPEPDDEVEDEILERRRAQESQESLVRQMDEAAMAENDPHEVKSPKPVMEVDLDDASEDMETYMNSADVYSVIGARNPVTAGDAQSVYTAGSAMTGVSIHTNRKRRPGAAKTRLAKDKEANAKTKGWHDTIQAAASSTNRTWRSDKGWKDYEDPHTENINQEQQEYEKIHLDLNIKKSKGSERPKAHDVPTEKVRLPFPVSWENERQELQSIATGFVPRDGDDDVEEEEYGEGEDVGQLDTASHDDHITREIHVESYEEKMPPNDQQFPVATAAAASPEQTLLEPPPDFTTPKKIRRRTKKPTPSLSPSRARAIEQEHRPRGWVESMKAATGAVSDDNSHWDPERGWNHGATNENSVITSDVADFSSPQSTGNSRETNDDDNIPPDAAHSVMTTTEDQLDTASSAVPIADDVSDDMVTDDNEKALVEADADEEVEDSKHMPDAAASIYADLLELDQGADAQSQPTTDDPIHVPSGRAKILAARRRRDANSSPVAESTLNDAEAAVYSDLADFDDDTNTMEQSPQITPLAPPSAEKAPRTKRSDFIEANRAAAASRAAESTVRNLDLDKTQDTSYDDSTNYDAKLKKKYFQIGDNGSVRSMYQSVAAKEMPERAVDDVKPKVVDENLTLERSESFPSLAGDRPEATVDIVKEKVGEEDLDLFPKQEKTEKRRILAKQEIKSREVDSSARNQLVSSPGPSVASSSILTTNRESRALSTSPGPREGEDGEGPVDLDDAHDEWAATDETQNAWDTRSAAASATSASHLSKTVPKLKANKRDTSPISVRSGRRREGSPTSERRELSPISVRSGKSVRSLRSSRSDRKEPTLGVAGPTPPDGNFQDPVALRRQGGSARLSPTSARDIVEDLTNAESILERAESLLSAEDGESRSFKRRPSPIDKRMTEDVSQGKEAMKLLKDEVAAAPRNPVASSLNPSLDDEVDTASARSSLLRDRALGPRLEEDFGVRQNAPLSPKDTRIRNHQLVQKVLDRSQSKRGALAPSEKDTPALNTYAPTEKRMNQHIRDDYKESKTEDDRDSLFMFDDKNAPVQGMTSAEKGKYDALSRKGLSAPLPEKKTVLSEDRVKKMLEEDDESGIEDDPSVGSGPYGPAEGDNRTFLQRLTECAAPVMASSSKMADMPSAHLAFLRSHPTSAPNSGNKAHGGMFSCGRPDVIHEEEEEKSEQSDKFSNKIRSREGKIETKKPNEKASSVVSEDFGAKTAYLEAIAMRTAVSKPSKKRRSKGDGTSSVVSTSSGHSEKWKAFLERKKSGLSADMASSSRKSTTSDVSKAAERYAAEKVNELRSKSAPKQRTDYPVYGQRKGGTQNPVRSVQSSTIQSASSRRSKLATPTATGNDADDLAAARFHAMMSVMAAGDEPSNTNEI